MNQSEPLASLGNSDQAREMGTNQHPWPAWETRTNQNSTPNPSPEGDQSDPETPVFQIFRENTLYKQCNPELRAPPYSCRYRWEPQLELGNKNSLAFTSDISSLVVIGRFHDLGITGNAIQPSHTLSSPSPPAFSLSQHHGLFQWVSSSHQVAKVLESPLQHQFFQWIVRTDFL